VEELLVSFFEDLRFVENQDSRVGIIEQCRFQGLHDWREKRSSRKQFAIVCKHELVIQILLVGLGGPPLASTSTPFASDLACDENVLHRKNIDVSHWST